MNELTQQRLDALLQANSMTPDRLDQTTLSQMFLAQMRVALYGGVSSIPVLPTFLKPFGTLHEGTPVAVAEIDDREVRVSLVTFSGGRAEVTDADRFPVPGREYPAPLADLLFAVAELAQPLLDRAKALALCLPFPIDYDWQGDGAIRSFPGTMTVSDFAQTPVLAALREEWKNRNVTPPPMTLVSLPAAVQLAAGALHPGQKRYVSLTWGSVFDLGFTAPGSIVVRQAGTPPALTPFACGFGHAQCVPFGLVDLIQDRDSYAPGQDLLLKMLSTEHLGDVYRLTMIKASERKLLTFGGSRDILSMRRLDLATMTEFLADPQNGGTLAHYFREGEDRTVALAVADAVLDRAARLACAALATVLQFIGAGQDPESPVCVALHGEAFSCPPLMQAFQTRVQTELAQRGLHLTLWQGENTPAVGAAAAALYAL